MSKATFNPTPQQNAVINHSRSAFISACPGGGKTEVIVERARSELKANPTGQGLAFLSFTNAAISELTNRLQAEALLPTPPFPHYAGTFDAFIWQFFIVPLGIPGLPATPKLVPDLNDRVVAPRKGAQELALKCFDQSTGKIIPEEAKLVGFDPAAKPGLTAKYEASAHECRERFIARGELDFGDVRRVVKGYLNDAALSAILTAALAARFREIVVDEAQDCDQGDIDIIKWLLGAGIVTKIVCDPHQSIFGFRGGVKGQLFALRDSFDPTDRLQMSGNFRSNPNICKAIAGFRAPGEQEATDQSLGPMANDNTRIHVVHYSGNSIPSSLGEAFKTLVQELRLDPTSCPLISSAKGASYKAIGQAGDTSTQHRTMRLALAVASFHAGVEINAREQAMEALHRIVLELGGKMGKKTYYQYIAAEDLKPEAWRPAIIETLRELRPDRVQDANGVAWLQRARDRLSRFLGANGGSIAQKIPDHHDLRAILDSKPMSNLSARTIHSVKGMEFPGVCVVLTKTNCKAIIDYLTTGQPSESAEGARKLYVAASRAERLLVIAVPKNQGGRLVAHIKGTGAEVTELSR